MIDCFQFVIYCTDFFWDFCLNTNHCLKILHSYQVFWNSALIFLVVLFQNSLLFQSPSEFFSSNKCYKSKNKTQNCKSFHHFSFLSAVPNYSTVTGCFRTENKIFVIFELFMKGFIKLNVFLFHIKITQ